MLVRLDSNCSIENLPYSLPIQVYYIASLLRGSNQSHTVDPQLLSRDPPVTVSCTTLHCLERAYVICPFSDVASPEIMIPCRDPQHLFHSLKYHTFFGVLSLCSCVSFEASPSRDARRQNSCQLRRPTPPFYAQIARLSCVSAQITLVSQ